MMMTLALEIEIGGEKIETRVRSERERGAVTNFLSGIIGRGSCCDNSTTTTT